MDIGEKNAIEHVWEAKETLTEAGYGEAIYLPGGDLSYVAHQLTGDGYVQVTVYPKADIEADTAEWIDVGDDELINPSDTAIRQVNSSGTTVLCVRCQ